MNMVRFVAALVDILMLMPLFAYMCIYTGITLLTTISLCLFAAVQREESKGKKKEGLSPSTSYIQ
jgi:predicted benzoate:H+ symporter BenE